MGRGRDLGRRVKEEGGNKGIQNDIKNREERRKGNDTKNKWQNV